MVVVAVESDSLARIGIALADSARRKILLALLAGPRYPTDLAEELGHSKANISNHLACLRGCGLVRAHPEGRRVRYDLADARLADALNLLAGLVLDIDPDCAVPSR